MNEPARPCRAIRDARPKKSVGTGRAPVGLLIRSSQAGPKRQPQSNSRHLGTDHQPERKMRLVGRLLIETFEKGLRVEAAGRAAIGGGGAAALGRDVAGSRHGWTRE